MTTGSFCLIRNEINFIEKHIQLWLPILDSMVFYDGNSTDGTLEILEKYAKDNPKIILVKDKDPKDFTYDYVRLSNECMWACPSDMAIFLHPDMFPSDNTSFKNMPEDVIAARVNMESYAGEPGGDIFKILGRGTSWKNIYRLRNPNMGAHYFGSYGAQNEDTYFSEITGDEHIHHGLDFDKYPYYIYNTDVTIKHYSDVRTYERRLERMKRCLVSQGMTEVDANKHAPLHPRVSFENKNGFVFIKTESPVFLK